VRQEDYGYVKGGDDAKEAKWFSVNELPPLAFDHEYILKIALERLRNKIRLEPIAFHLLNKTFTMTQVQSIYEAVLEQKYDRRNFHKKMTALGYIIPTGDKQTANGRPGNLYSFDEDKYNEEVNKRSAI
jgi:8-oxo-dGTP diphosphatase